MRFNIRSAYGKCYDDDIEVLKKYNLEIIPTTPEINVSKPKEEYYITINTIDELLNLRKELKYDLIIEEDGYILIYDSWIE